MVTNAINVQPPGPAPIGEKAVRYIEEMSPVVPLVACLMWGALMILLSFAFGLAKFQDGPKYLGWIYEINWSLTFAFFIPLSLYFSSSVLTSVPQVIATLARGRMVRNDAGELASPADLISNWRRRAGKSAWLAWSLGVIGFVVSWIMYWVYCFRPAFGLGRAMVHSWQNAVAIVQGVSTPPKLAIFGFLAYTSQGAAIACYLYYIIMIFTFAAWVFDYTKFDYTKTEPGAGIFPDLSEADNRYGFERFEPLIENVLLASIAFFFQFFMTRLFYIYMADKSSTSMFDLISHNMGPGFVEDVGALFSRADPSLFDFGSDLHLQDTMMIVATLVAVISAFLVPAVIVRQAAWRSRARLQEAIGSSPDIAMRWYNIDAAEAERKLDGMTFWPIRYAQPMQLLVLILLAAACFFAYKLTLLLIAAILYKGVKQFLSAFR